MRASDWFDLPAFTIADIYDENNQWIERTPPDIPYYNYTFTLSTYMRMTGVSAAMGAAYFGSEPPPGFNGTVPGLVNAGKSHAGYNYYPGLDSDEWSSADLSYPNPPRDNFADQPWWGTNDVLTVGRWSMNAHQWLLLEFDTIGYRRYMTYGRMDLPSNLNLDFYWSESLRRTFPAGSGNDSWSWAETNLADPATPPVLPESGVMSMHITTDETRTGGMLYCYAAWVNDDGTNPVSDLWVEDTPSAPWVQIGSVGFSPSGGWVDMALDFSGIAVGNAGVPDVRGQYHLAMIYRIIPNEFTLPNLGWETDGPYWYGVTWDNMRLAVTYPAGSIKYRYIGPEVYDTGPSAPTGIYVGVIDRAGTIDIVTVRADNPATILDTLTWPFPAEYLPNYLHAIARPSGRVGDAVTLVVLNDSWAPTNTCLARITVDDAGSITAHTAEIGASATIVNGSQAGMYGSNETSKILLARTGRWTDYALLNTATGVTIPVSGIYPSDGDYEWSNLAAFTQGDTYLVYQFTRSTVGYDVLRLQRYRISTTTGVATPVGPLMTVPQLDSVNINTFYATPEPRDVWDDGSFVAVGLSVWDDDANYSKLFLAIFDNTSTSPRHFLELYADTVGFLSNATPTSITFSAVKGAYYVSYVRGSLRPVAGNEESTGWYTYVHRTVDPVTGTLGPEIFVSDADTDYGFQRYNGGHGGSFVRADNASTLAYIERYPYEDKYPSKIEIINSSDSTSEGGVQLTPWYGFTNGLHGWTWAYAWVGIKEEGGKGRLYFKYRWP